MDWNVLITVLSLVGGILAWVAKIRWSAEYTTAKNETIKAKEAEIELLKSTIQKYKDFSPEIVLRLYETTKKASDEYISLSDQELKAAQVEIERLKIEGEKSDSKLNSTKSEISNLIKERDNLSKELLIIKRNPFTIPQGTLVSASGSSIAISNMLNRGTAAQINQASSDLSPFLVTIPEVSPELLVPKPTKIPPRVSLHQ